MKKSNSQINKDIQGIANLVQYSEQYPKGAIKIGYYYYEINSLIEVLKDLRTRSSLGEITKTDKLMMQILSGIL